MSVKPILFLVKAVRRGDTATHDMFGAAPALLDTHVETKTRKDGVVQTYHVGNISSAPLPRRANGAKVGDNRGGKPQAPHAGEKPMTVTPADPRGLDKPETYTNDTALATLARRLAESDFAQRPAGSISRGDLKREYLEGKHADKVAAALDATAQAQAKSTATAAAIQPPAGYTLTTSPAVLTLKGPFHEDLHASIKRAGGHWDSPTKTWQMPADKASSLKRILSNFAKKAPSPEDLAAQRAAVQASANRKELVRWLGYIEEKVPEGYLYANGVAKLKELGVASHPDLQARLDAAIAQVAAVKVRQEAEKTAARQSEATAIAQQGGKTYLRVPFEQKDAAKRAGARWDPAQRAWYVVGQVPEALHPYWPQRPLPEGQFRISGGEGYGFRPLVVGEVIRNPRPEGPRHVVVVSASKQYYREDGLSFGVGADEGHIYSGVVRPATDSESAPLRQAEERADHVQAAKTRVKALKERFTQEGERPEEPQLVHGDLLLDTQNIYGGGDWWVIQPDAIWYVRNNGMDGDNWAMNNVRTGGAGAIGWKMPRDPEVEAQLREADALTRTPRVTSISAVTTPTRGGLTVHDVVSATATQDDLKARPADGRVYLDAKSQYGQWVNGGFVDLANGRFVGSGLKGERWVRQSLRYLQEQGLLAVKLDGEA